MHENTYNVLKLTTRGWALYHWAADPVVWVPREFNDKADSLCNKSKELKAPHLYRHHEIASIIHSGFNIKISTDGGVRGGTISGTGWVVYAVQVGVTGNEGKHVNILEGGQYHGRGMSSLEVEIRALEEALDHLCLYT